MSDISKLIAEKAGYSNLPDDLNNKLSGSELNSLLLELFRKRIKKISLATLLNDFDKNRFSDPSTVETISFKRFELICLELATEKKIRCCYIISTYIARSLFCYGICELERSFSFAARV